MISHDQELILDIGDPLRHGMLLVIIQNHTPYDYAGDKSRHQNNDKDTRLQAAQRKEPFQFS